MDTLVVAKTKTLKDCVLSLLPHNGEFLAALVQLYEEKC